MRLRRRLGGVAVLLALAGAVVGAAPAHEAALSKNPTFNLVKIPGNECPAPKVRLGRACWDKSGQILSQNWQVSDGSAFHNPTGWNAQYNWTMPAKVTASGAGIKLTLSVLEKQGSGSGICRSIGVRGGMPLKNPKQNPDVNICAQANQSASGSKTVNVVAPSSGPVYVVVGLGDGPQLTYKYVAEPDRCEDQRNISFRLEHKDLNSRAEGQGKLKICGTKKPGVTIIATEATGRFEHSDRDGNVVSFKVTRGSYNRNARYAGVNLAVEVVQSADPGCRVGAVGKLSLIADRVPRRPPSGGYEWDDRFSLRLCGSKHTHAFSADDGSDVKVWIE